jgi:hypothetical protein
MPTVSDHPASVDPASLDRKTVISLNSVVICPNCWHRFPPDSIWWIATNPILNGDPVLGSDAQLRFLPTRFNVHGSAIDSRGSVCDRMACPRCRLVVPRPCLETKPIFLSIAGTPSCGKSFLLASMTNQLRSVLPSKLKLSYRDADATCNQNLTAYEEQLFYSHEPDKPIRLRKTEEQGDDYAATTLDGIRVQLVSPFLFSISPVDGHPNIAHSIRCSRVVALYDNAGESFAPGSDAANNPVTRHLGQSLATLFCYDPMQDARLRSRLVGKTDDVQITDQVVTARQETVLYEVIERIRRLRGMSQSEKSDRPLMVLVTKYDSWRSLLPDTNLELIELFATREDGLKAIDLRVIREVNKRTRDLLAQTSPDLVAAVESFTNNPWFIPVSATGVPPLTDPETKITGVKPKDLKPIWCEVPMLVALALSGSGLLPFIDTKSNVSGTAQAVR